jgi:hypothetical protein
MIKHLTYFQILGLLLLLAMPVGLQAQDGSSKPTEKEEDKPKLSFNGLGRANLLSTGIDGAIRETDSTLVDQLTDGEFLLDLAINATPNDKTEIQTILRLRNEFGGFFGAGVSVEVRELWARGIIGDVVEYRAGDMDVAMTPYSLFLFDEEGSVNQAEVFNPQREIIYYEQFYGDENQRRLQGAKLDFGLEFAQLIDEMEFTGFLARIRGTDFFSLPTRLVSGGQIDLIRNAKDSLGFQGNVGINYVNTWDDIQSGDFSTAIRNPVVTVDFNVTLLDRPGFALHVLGEAGQSFTTVANDSTAIFEEDDTFLDVGVALDLKPQNLRLSASFVDVGPDFFSMGAQSKRVDFEREKTYYNRVGKDDAVRMPTLFDLSRDRALYNFQLSDQLMAYDPRYSNAQPYGMATPNRRGLRLGVDFQPEDGWLDLDIDGALLSEIRGQGTFELKQFTLIRTSADLHVHKLADWDKTCTVTLGHQFEQTSRDGVEVEQVDLQSNLLEAGLEAELFKNLDLLLGLKMLNAVGNDYVPILSGFNEVQDFPEPLVVDDTETMLGAGLRYRFKEGIYVTAQYQQFDLSRANDPGNDYQLNQFFVLYQMNF